MDLVVLSVSALGFGKQGASLKDIYARAKSLGLRFALPRSDRNYRLQYLEQPPGEVLHIAMDRIAKYDGNLVSLALENGEWGHVTALRELAPFMPLIRKALRSQAVRGVSCGSNSGVTFAR